MDEKNWASVTALKGVISAVRKERGRFDADVQRLRLKSRDYFGTSLDYSHPVGFTQSPIVTQRRVIMTERCIPKT